MKIQSNNQGKKQPTNPERKEAHQNRRAKKEILQHIYDDDWEQQLKDFYGKLHRVAEK